MFFTDLSIHSYGVTLVVFVLTSVLFSTAGFHQRGVCEQF